MAFLLSAQVLAETPDLVTALSSVEINKEKFDSNGISKLVGEIETHSSEVSERKKRAVRYYCYSEELEGGLLDLNLSVAEFTDRKRERAESLDKCYKVLLSVYKELEEKAKKVQDKGDSFEANKKALEDIYRENKKTLSGQNLYIKYNDIPAQLFSNREAPRKVALSDYFSLREKAGKKETDDDRKVNAPLSFSVKGCAAKLNDEERADNESVTPEDGEEIRKIEARVKVLEENQAGNMPVTCSVDDAGVLTLSPKSVVSGYRDLKITASYTENGVDVEKDAFLPVKVSSFKAQGCSAWNCQSHYSFLLGAEGTSMSEVKKETILRYEFASYHMLSDNFHMFGRIFQTSTPDEESCEGEAEGCEEELIEAVTADIGGNYLFWESTRANEEGRHVLRGGLTAQYGIYKSGNADRDFAEYYYSGIRFAHHKQRYFDILYGKREDLLGRRIKFKGQVPVYNDNFVVGVEIEVAADGDMRKAGLSNQDSIKAFVLYQVDFAGFIK